MKLSACLRSASLTTSKSVTYESNEEKPLHPERLFVDLCPFYGVVNVRQSVEKCMANVGEEQQVTGITQRSPALWPGFSVSARKAG
jgi:hypothetical protein